MNKFSFIATAQSLNPKHQARRRKEHKPCKHCNQTHSPCQTFQCIKCLTVCCGMMVGKSMKTSRYIHAMGSSCAGECIQIEPTPFSKFIVEKNK